MQNTVARPLNGQTISFDSTVGGVKNSTAIASSYVGLKTTQAVYIKFGYENTVTVSSSDYDIFLESTDGRVDVDTGGAKYIAAIRSTTDGTLYINEWTKEVL